jgi:predicted amidophosphoribosyltransferase
MLDTLAEALFPSRCAACGKLCGTPSILCGQCLAECEPADPTSCGMCGGPQPDLPRPATPWPSEPFPLPRTTPFCPRCRAFRPSFEELRAAFVYGGPIRDALLALKHSGRLETGRRLGGLAAGHLPPPPGPCLVIPVPLHPHRLAERGYNQALLLARGMGSAWRQPVRTDILVRTRDTGSHRGRSAVERRSALTGAFSVRQARLPPGSTVLLIDDVAASRSTSLECARVLKSAGASEVRVRVVASSME